MLLSKTCEYAIRAMIYIAQQSSKENRVGIKAIAANIESPEYFIAKILQDLSRKGFVQSAKGPNGGFFMDDEHMRISLADIVREIDGDQLFVECGLGLKECSADHPCPIHFRFGAIRNEIKNMLEESLVANFIDGLDLNLTFLKK